MTLWNRAIKSPVTGSRNTLPVDSAGNLIVGQSVPLLTQGNLQWGPWAITLDPMSTRGYQTSPYPPENGFGRTGEPRCVVGFGVGGLRRVVEFDYPFAGGCLVVNTDRVDVSVRATLGGAVDVPSGVQGPPAVGAWLTPASQQAVSTPLMMTMRDIANPGGFCFVPSFAKRLVVSPYDAGAALLAGTVIIQFATFGAASNWQYQFSYPAGGPTQPIVVDVPALATGVNIFVDTAPKITSFFELSLA